MQHAFPPDLAPRVGPVGDRAPGPIRLDRPVGFRRGERDQRKRLLTLTERGTALERELFQSQRLRVAEAYHRAGAEAVEGFRQVLLNLMDPAVRWRFEERAERT